MLTKRHNNFIRVLDIKNENKMNKPEIEITNVHLSIDIPKNINDELKEIARSEGRSVKSLLRRIIKNYVNDTKESL